jgi:hypothetical protein
MKDDYEVSPRVVAFRNILEELKRKIIEEGTETYKSKSDIQDIDRLNPVVRRIRQLKPEIESIMNNQPTPTNEKINSFFESNNVRFQNLTDDERNTCLHILHVDLYMYPLTLNPEITSKALKSKRILDV